MIAAVPSSTSAAELAPGAWPSDDDEHSGERDDRADDRARPIFSSRKSAASSSAISGAMKVSAMACASGTRPMPQKNRNAMTVTIDAAGDVDLAASCRLGQGFGAADRAPALSDRLASDAPDADGDDADDQHEMLHHRVHDRQRRATRRERATAKAWTRMLGRRGSPRRARALAIALTRPRRA